MLKKCEFVLLILAVLCLAISVGCTVQTQVDEPVVTPVRKGDSAAVIAQDQSQKPWVFTAKLATPRPKHLVTPNKPDISICPPDTVEGITQRLEQFDNEVRQLTADFGNIVPEEQQTVLQQMDRLYGTTELLRRLGRWVDGRPTATNQVRFRGLVKRLQTLVWSRQELHRYIVKLGQKSQTQVKK